MGRSKREDRYARLLADAWRLEGINPHVEAAPATEKQVPVFKSAMDYYDQFWATHTPATIVEKPAGSAGRKQAAGQGPRSCVVVHSNATERRVADCMPWRSAAKECGQTRIPGERFQYGQERQKVSRGSMPSPIATGLKVLPRERSCCGDEAQHNYRRLRKAWAEAKQNGPDLRTPCGACNQLGHHMLECPELWGPHASLCMTCGQRGHGSETCPWRLGTTGGTGGHEREPRNPRDRGNVSAIALGNSGKFPVVPAGGAKEHKMLAVISPDDCRGGMAGEKPAEQVKEIQRTQMKPTMVPERGGKTVVHALGAGTVYTLVTETDSTPVREVGVTPAGRPTKPFVRGLPLPRACQSGEACVKNACGNTMLPCKVKSVDEGKIDIDACSRWCNNAEMKSVTDACYDVPCKNASSATREGAAEVSLETLGRLKRLEPEVSQDSCVTGMPDHRVATVLSGNAQTVNVVLADTGNETVSQCTPGSCGRKVEVKVAVGVTLGENGLDSLDAVCNAAEVSLETGTEPCELEPRVTQDSSAAALLGIVEYSNGFALQIETNVKGVSEIGTTYGVHMQEDKDTPLVVAFEELILSAEPLGSPWREVLRQWDTCSYSPESIDWEGLLKCLSPLGGDVLPEIPETDKHEVVQHKLINDEKVNDGRWTEQWLMETRGCEIAAEGGCPEVAESSMDAALPNKDIIRRQEVVTCDVTVGDDCSPGCGSPAEVALPENGPMSRNAENDTMGKYVLPNCNISNLKADDDDACTPVLAIVSTETLNGEEVDGLRSEQLSAERMLCEVANGDGCSRVADFSANAALPLADIRGTKGIIGDMDCGDSDVQDDVLQKGDDKCDGDECQGSEQWPVEVCEVAVGGGRMLSQPTDTALPHPGNMTEIAKNQQVNWFDMRKMRNPKVRVGPGLDRDGMPTISAVPERGAANQPAHEGACTGTAEILYKTPGEFTPDHGGMVPGRNNNNSRLEFIARAAAGEVAEQAGRGSIDLTNIPTESRGRPCRKAMDTQERTASEGDSTVTHTQLSLTGLGEIDMGPQEGDPIETACEADDTCTPANVTAVRKTDVDGGEHWETEGDGAGMLRQGSDTRSVDDRPVDGKLSEGLMTVPWCGWKRRRKKTLGQGLDVQMGLGPPVVEDGLSDETRRDIDVGQSRVGGSGSFGLCVRSSGSEQRGGICGSAWQCHGARRYRQHPGVSARGAEWLQGSLLARKELAFQPSGVFLDGSWDPGARRFRRVLGGMGSPLLGPGFRCGQKVVTPVYGPYQEGAVEHSGLQLGRGSERIQESGGLHPGSQCDAIQCSRKLTGPLQACTEPGCLGKSVWSREADQREDWESRPV